MRKLCLFLCLMLFVVFQSQVRCQSEGIPVFQGNIELNRDGRTFSYAFAQGDKVLLKVVTGKRKELRNIRITTLSGDVVWSKENTPGFEEEISLSREGVYTLSVEKKGLFNQTIGLDIIRKPGAVADYNPAWTKHNRYKAEVVSFKVDTAVGYESAVQNEIDLKVFNKYLFQNISLYNFKDQVKGNLALDGNHVQGFPMGVDPNKVPKGAKFKCYTYSLNSVLGGQKHWAIAELAGQIGGTAASIFLTPAAGFAVHGAMALVGPAPNKAPVMYYMSNRHSDIKTIGEMKSNTGKAKGAVNTYTNAVSSVIGLVNKDAGKAVKKATELDTKTEADLDYTQKGNITNLFVNSAIPPTEKYFIMTNSYLMHAKNIHLSATAMYYVPSFFTVKAKEEVFNLKKEQIEKTETKFSKTTEYVSIKY
ncbi:MAG: hypothetical protein JXR27_09015 [Paludibacteraceae bacterium]|nr:hypothetical protein [Paludibacteraceae bacterium]